MKTKFFLITLIFVAAGGYVVAQKSDDVSPNEPRIKVCHKGKTLLLPESAVRAHLAHGDTLGECPPQ